MPLIVPIYEVKVPAQFAVRNSVDEIAPGEGDFQLAPDVLLRINAYPSDNRWGPFPAALDSRQDGLAHVALSFQLSGDTHVRLSRPEILWSSDQAAPPIGAALSPIVVYKYVGGRIAPFRTSATEVMSGPRDSGSGVLVYGTTFSIHGNPQSFRLMLPMIVVGANEITMEPIAIEFQKKGRMVGLFQ